MADSDLPDIDAIQQDAKEKFSLADKLQGISNRTGKVLIYTDLDAVKLYNVAKKKYDDFKTRSDFMADGLKDPDTGELIPMPDGVRERFQKELDDASAELETATQAMLKGALSVHLKAIPRSKLKYYRVKGMEGFKNKKGNVAEEHQDAYKENVERLVLQEMLNQIVDAEGNEYDLDADTLQDQLSDSQYQRVTVAMNDLLLEDVIASLATDDPGF